MTKKLSVQHPTANLPRGRQCSHDLLALRNTEAHIFPPHRFTETHTNPVGVMSLVSAALKGLETEFKLLIVRERDTELLITPLKEENM